MRVSLELYLLVNFLMNAMIIGVSARSLGQVSWKKVCFASAFGAIYAAAMQWAPYRALAAWPMRAALLVLLALLSMRVDRLRDVLDGSARLAAASLFAGGAMLWARQLAGARSWPALLIAAPAIGLALMAALGERSRRLDRWEVRLLMRGESGIVRLNALIDTGNRLREPLSGLPVLVAEFRAVKKLLPPGFDLELAQRRLPPGCRAAYYGALGGGGRLILIKPREVFLSYGEGWVRAPDLWVGLYPGRMPGSVRALAPPIIGRVQPARGVRIGSI